MNVEDLEAGVAVLRAKASLARDALIAAIQEQYRPGLEDVVQRLINAQPDVIIQMDPADRAVLKVNIATTINSAADSIPSVAGPKLDIEVLAKEARRNTTGAVRANLGTSVSDTTSQLWSLLAQAGFAVASFSKGGSSAKSFREVDLALRSHAEVMAFNTAVEKYGLALIELDDARKAEAAAEASRLWSES